MKVLLITGYIPSRGGGGVERHVYDLAAGLIRRGVDVSIACEDVQNFPGNYELLKDRLILKTIPRHDILKPVKAIGRLSKAAGSVEFSARLLRRSWALSKTPGEYDIIHGHAQAGAVALAGNRLRRGKRPATVATLHGTAAGFFGSMRKYRLGPPVPTPEVAASALMELASARSADACIAVSQNVGTIARQSYRVPEKKMHVIYNWADRGLFYPRGREESRRALGLAPDKKYLLFVGRTDPMKGYRLLLDAMGYVGDKATLLVASGAREEGFPNVEFLGFVDEQLPLYYSACDLFVFPSVYEGLPLTLVEAISCGAVPVCMGLPPMDEVVDGAMGYVCGAFRPEELARTLLGALEDGGRGEKSVKCIEKAGTFDMDRSIDATLELYRSLL